MADNVNAPPREQALLVGERRALVGILSQPRAEASPDPLRPVVVLLNAGIVHRVGPNRMHVELARHLASCGFTVLRFDLAGVGDSPSRSDGLAPLQASLADVREVLDWLEASRGARRFVLGGLCSGADHALLHAKDDPRVAGLVLLDPSLPRTRGFYYRHWARRLVSLRTWLSIASGRHPTWRRVLRILARVKPAEAVAATTPDLESPEVRAALENAYRGALSHGTRLLAVFAGTGGREYRINYREQMLDAFPSIEFGDALQLEYVQDADHTFAAERHRSQLIGSISDWMRHFC